MPQEKTSRFFWPALIIGIGVVMIFFIIFYFSSQWQEAGTSMLPPTTSGSSFTTSAVPLGVELDNGQRGQVYYQFTVEYDGSTGKVNVSQGEMVGIDQNTFASSMANEESKDSLGVANSTSAEQQEFWRQLRVQVFHAL